MKKSTLLKVALFLTAIFVYGNAMAQPATIVHGGAYNYTPVGATTTYQTTGLGLTLYVAPDIAYSPAYDGTGAVGTGLNPLSTWQWVYGANFAGGSVVKGWANQNYVALTTADLPATGTRLFWVAERYNALCSDPTGVSQLITILPEPDGTLVGNNTAGDWGVVGSVFTRCGDGVAEDLVLTFSEAGTPSPNFAYQITATAIRYNGAGSPVDATGTVITDPADATDVTGTYGLETVADITTITVGDFVTSPQTVTIPTNMTLLQVAGKDVRTKYVFTLTGVASQISSLSHIRAGSANAYYAPTAAQTVTYWLNPQPVTGPIYHISNSYAF